MLANLRAVGDTRVAILIIYVPYNTMIHYLPIVILIYHMMGYEGSIPLHMSLYGHLLIDCDTSRKNPHLFYVRLVLLRIQGFTRVAHIYLFSIAEEDEEFTHSGTCRD